MSRCGHISKLICANMDQMCMFSDSYSTKYMSVKLQSEHKCFLFTKWPRIFRLLWGNTLSYHWNLSLSAWISAVFCFGSVVFTVYRVQTLGRNWRDLTRTESWLSKMTYGVSEIRQLSTFQRMERMIVWFHAHFIFYQSTDPPYLLINGSFSIYNS